MFDIYENTTYETQIELEKRIKLEKLPTRLVVIIGSVYNYKRLKMSLIVTGRSLFSTPPLTSTFR